MRAAGFVALLLACSYAGGNDCPSTGVALCQRALTCADGGTPRFIVGSGDVSFSSLGQCETAYDVGCANRGDAGTVDYGACSAAIPDASCGASVNGGGVVVPAACLQ